MSLSQFSQPYSRNSSSCTLDSADQLHTTVMNRHKQIIYSGGRLLSLRRSYNITRTSTSNILASLRSAGIFRFRICRAGRNKSRQFPVIKNHRPSSEPFPFPLPTPRGMDRKNPIHPMYASSCDDVRCPSIYVINACSLAKPHAAKTSYCRINEHFR